jgi:hypothetical protein
MDRAEAEGLCAELARDHPDRETHRWVPHQTSDGSWSVAKIGLAPTRDELTSESRADEKPPTPDDPRPGVFRDVGPYAAGG